MIPGGPIVASTATTKFAQRSHDKKLARVRIGPLALWQSLSETFAVGESWSHLKWCYVPIYILWKLSPLKLLRK